MDLTPIKTALRNKLGYEVLTAQGNPKQVRLLGRLHSNRVGDFLVFVHHIHIGWLERKKPGWTADLCKLYFPHPQTKKVVFGWRFIFGADDVEKHLPDIESAIRSSPASTRVEVMEVPLVGASRSRDSLVRGKGVQSSEKAVVGPMALARMAQGSR